MTCAIVLAAGKSERMGTQKLLLPYADSTMIARVVDAFLSVPVDLVCVVVRSSSEAIRTALASRPVIFAENAATEGDMLSSVRAGLRALPENSKIILVTPGDQPAITSTVIRNMIEHFRRVNAKILVPVCKGRRGHPLLFSSAFREQILAEFEDTGLRGLLLAHPAAVTEWVTSDPAVLQDLDTPQDLITDKAAGSGYLGPMKSPFPGMDPYLESYWGDVHTRLVLYTCDALQSDLPHDLRARVEERVFLEIGAGVSRRVAPDIHIAETYPTGSEPLALREGTVAVAEPGVFEVTEERIAERYVEIRDRSGGKLVTVIEFLSPGDKLGGVGQQKYVEKQQQVLRSDASLVEIDLVRTGSPVLALPNNAFPPSPTPQAIYLTSISRAWQRVLRERCVMPLRQRLPRLPIPLRQHEQPLALDLQSVLDQAYAAGRYDDIDYGVDPVPPLPPQDAAWAADLLKAAGRR